MPGHIINIPCDDDDGDDSNNDDNNNYDNNNNAGALVITNSARASGNPLGNGIFGTQTQRVYYARGCVDYYYIIIVTVVSLML